MTSGKDVDLEHSLISLWAKKREEKVEKRAYAYREYCCCGIVLLSLGLQQGPGKDFGRSEKVEDRVK